MNGFIIKILRVKFNSGQLIPVNFGFVLEQERIFFWDDFDDGKKETLLFLLIKSNRMVN